MKYAKGTTVSEQSSRAEIEKTLRRYGADQFAYGSDDSRGMASIQFRANGRHVRFVLIMPDPADFEFSGRGMRTPAQQQKAWEQGCRQRWRALALAVKAKLEVIESGIATFDDEFLANIVVPGDQTVGELLAPQIEQAYLTGEEPQGIAGLLPSPE